MTAMPHRPAARTAYGVGVMTPLHRTAFAVVASAALIAATVVAPAQATAPVR